MKKVLSMLLAVVMMLVTVSTSSYAATPAELVISGAELTAKAGDTVEVPIVIEVNSGFAGLNLYFTYPDELTFVSLTNAVSALTCTSDATTVWDAAADYTGTGNLAVLKFTVSANAEYKEYPVEVHFIEAFDLLGNDVDTSVNAGSVKVVCVSADADGNHVDSNNKWEGDEVNHFRTCGCGTVFDSAPHSGGSATCAKKAECATCGKEYGLVKEHSYTATTIKAEALMTAGNCRDKAVYYYSCAGCGLVEGDANHIFEGAKVVTSHVGGTTLVNVSEANHTTQTNGYTGDTKCLGCNEIIAYGQPIPADAHTPATNWVTDGTYHWKECVVSGCGVVIDGTKEEHYSNKVENKATCQSQAVCDACGVSYSTVATHNWETTYSKDATGHWYACQTTGCNEKNGFAAHTPDHEGGATDEYAIKCTECEYVIEAQLPHTCVYDKEVAKDVYKASNASCNLAATYYKSCKCGAFHTNETFSYGEPAGHSWDEATCTAPKTCSVCHTTEGEKLGHIEGTEWENNASEHWHICTRTGCGAVIESSKATHTPDCEEPTEENDVLCTECGYMMATIRVTHYHVHGKEWKFNQYEHWNECSCSNRAFIDRHEDANLDGKCDVCGWDVPIPAGAIVTPTSPKTGHNSMVWIWATLAGLCGLACAAANVLRKRK